MALRENNMLVMLEVGQVTGKPQFQAWGGSTRREALYGQGFITKQSQKYPCYLCSPSWLPQSRGDWLCDLGTPLLWGEGNAASTAWQQRKFAPVIDFTAPVVSVCYQGALSYLWSQAEDKSPMICS